MLHSCLLSPFHSQSLAIGSFEKEQKFHGWDDHDGSPNIEGLWVLKLRLQSIASLYRRTLSLASATATPVELNGRSAGSMSPRRLQGCSGRISWLHFLYKNTTFVQMCKGYYFCTQSIFSTLKKVIRKCINI